MEVSTMGTEKLAALGQVLFEDGCRDGKAWAADEVMAREVTAMVAQVVAETEAAVDADRAEYERGMRVGRMGVVRYMEKLDRDGLRAAAALMRDTVEAIAHDPLPAVLGYARALADGLYEMDCVMVRAATELVIGDVADRLTQGCAIAVERIDTSDGSERLRARLPNGVTVRVTVEAYFEEQ
jgi:hypothetical protein